MAKDESWILNFFPKEIDREIIALYKKSKFQSRHLQEVEGANKFESPELRINYFLLEVTPMLKEAILNDPKIEFIKDEPNFSKVIREIIANELSVPVEAADHFYYSRIARMYIQLGGILNGE